MSGTKCHAKDCTAKAKPWRSSSVADFMEDNPGWFWVINAAAETFVLCPQHATEIALLVAQIENLVGDFCVNAMLRRIAREKGLIP